MSTCAACGYIHTGTDARAVGRFTPSPTYVAAHAGTPARATRAEAEADECAWRQNKPSPVPVVTAPDEPPSPPAVPHAIDEGDGLASAGESFPVSAMETAARAKAWRDFLAEVQMSLMVWQLDANVRTGCEDVRAWLRRCRDDLAGLTPC